MLDPIATIMAQCIAVVAANGDLVVHKGGRGLERENVPAMKQSGYSVYVKAAQRLRCPSPSFSLYTCLLRETKRRNTREEQDRPGIARDAVLTREMEKTV